jgi:hypothetical protein
MDIGNLYIKYKVPHYNLHDKYVINGKGPPLGSDYYNMYDYLDNCKVEPPTTVFINYPKEILSKC